MIFIYIFSDMPYYREYLPNKHFQKYIKSIWFLEIDKNEEFSESLVVPDNTIELVFSNTPITRENNRTGKKQIMYTQLAGLKSTPQKLSLEPGCNTAGIRFKPYGLAKFANIDLSDTVDLTVDPIDIFGNDFSYLEEEVISGNDKLVIMLRMEHFLFSKMLETDRRDDPFIEFAMQKIETGKGNIKFDRISNEFGISLKTIERRFAEWVGIPPKKFARMYRFYRTMKSFIESKPHKLAELAYRNGYFDQTHFIKEVKEFTGLTPRAYFNTDNTCPDHNLQHALHGYNAT